MRWGPYNVMVRLWSFRGASRHFMELCGASWQGAISAVFAMLRRAKPAISHPVSNSIIVIARVVSSVVCTKIKNIAEGE